LQRGLVQAPRFIPLFLSDEGTQGQIAALKRSGSFNHVLSGA
jgi:hypothetical protein